MSKRTDLPIRSVVRVKDSAQKSLRNKVGISGVFSWDFFGSHIRKLEKMVLLVYNDEN